MLPQVHRRDISPATLEAPRRGCVDLLGGLLAWLVDVSSLVELTCLVVCSLAIVAWLVAVSSLVELTCVVVCSLAVVAGLVDVSCLVELTCVVVCSLAGVVDEPVQL